MAFVKPLTAQQAVVEELRRAIRQGELPPGEQIVQEAMAERWGVSRVPIREALKILEGEGRVSYQVHQGYFVSALDISELVENYRIRQLLEAEAAREAVRAFGPNVIAEMEENIDVMAAASEAGDLLALGAANRRFHFALYEAGGMPRLTQIVEQLWDATEPYRLRYFVSAESRARVDLEHRAMVDALRERDAPKLIELMDGHRTNAVEALKQILDEDQAERSRRKERGGKSRA